MNALLFAHLAVRLTLTLRAHRVRPSGNRGVALAVLALGVLASLDVAIRLYSGALTPALWGLSGWLTHTALLDVLITAALGASVRLVVRFAQSQDESERRIIRASERAREEEHTAACRRMADGFVHRVSSLLTTLRSATELLEQGLSFEPQSRPQLMRLQAALEIGEALAEDLYAMSGEQEFAPKRVKVNGILSDVVVRLQNDAPAGVRVLSQLDAAAGSVVADPRQLERCLWRLVVNAVDAMPSGGGLEISTTLLHVDLGDDIELAPGRWVCVEIRDTGPGMSPEACRKALEPFYSTSGKKGLGLPAVVAFADQCGGRFDLRSRIGVGSTGRLYLPAAVTRVRTTQVSDVAPAPRRAKPRVLVAEDTETVRVAARELLVSIGCDVVTAVDGQDALDLAVDADFGFDLVLTDVVMPRLSGPELAEALLSHSPNLPIVFMTGHQQAAFVRGYLPDDCGVISKPFGVEELRLSVMMALNKRGPVGEGGEELPTLPLRETVDLRRGAGASIATSSDNHHVAPTADA
ncbi:MAG: response regulator [Myxococcales bacterium]|nr:response regulator [Myxococcales bacterium]